jgi:circadian clock protein KaiB
MKEDLKIKSATEAFENALKNDNKEHYTLRLFVSGMTPGSIRAIKNIKQICKVHLAGRFELEVIDIYQQPELGKSEQIIVAPTLIKKMPLPLKKIHRRSFRSRQSPYRIEHNTQKPRVPQLKMIFFRSKAQ